MGRNVNYGGKCWTVNDPGQQEKKMKMTMWIYRGYLDGVRTMETANVYAATQYARLFPSAVVYRIYSGNSYDPVLHYTTYYDSEGGWSARDEPCGNPSTCGFSCRDYDQQKITSRNCLRIEDMRTYPLRCRLKPPDHWPPSACDRSLNWILSGGSATVFGICTPRMCPEILTPPPHTGT